MMPIAMAIGIEMFSITGYTAAPLSAGTWRGINITAVRNAEINGIITYSNTMDWCRIRDSTGAQVANGTFAEGGGTICTFNSSIKMYTNEDYYLERREGPAGNYQEVRYTDYASKVNPYEGTILNITCSILPDGTCHDGLIYSWDINGINYTNYTSPTNFSITAKDGNNISKSITNFTAIINGTTYYSVAGTITTDLYTNSTSLYNITISSNQTEGYFNNTIYTNISSSLVAYLYNYYESSTEPILLWNYQNMTFESSLNITDAYLTFNGSIKNINKTNLSNSRYFNYYNQVTSISNLSETYQYYWTYTYDGVRYNTTTRNQIWYKIFLGNCTSEINQSSFAVYSYDEQYLNQLNITLLYSIKFWSNNINDYATTNGELKGQNVYPFCIYPSNATVYADIYFQNIAAFTHRYYIYNGTFTDTNMSINLYNFNSTIGISDLSVTVKDISTYTDLENIIGRLERYYVGEGIWRLVQMDKSGVYGLLFFNIKEENTDYRLIYMDTSNNFLKNTTTLKFICTAGICSVVQVLDPDIVQEVADELVVDATYSNITKLITVTWNDPKSLINTVNIKVLKQTSPTDTVYCSSSLSGSSGTYRCNITSAVGLVYVYVTKTRNGVTQPTFSKFFDLVGNYLYTAITQEEGAFWVFVITLMFTAIGVMISPAAVPLGAAAGIIASYFFHLTPVITYTFVITVVGMGFVIAYKIKK
jgi:hypothetical protein